MIEKLTKEQEEKLATYREKWLKIGLDTKTDRKKSEKAIDKVYKSAGLDAPKIKIWLASPHEGAIGAALLTGTKAAGDQVRALVRALVWDQVWDQVRDQVWDQVRDQVRDQVWDQVRDQVGDQVWDQVRDQVWDQVRDQVGDQVWDQVRDQVWDQVRDQVGDQVWDQVRDQVRDQVYRCGYGLHDAEWLGFYEFFLNECGIKDAQKLKPQMELARYCGWWWPFKDAVIFTEKPTEIYRNARNQLHRDGGPALKYSDGYSLYRLNGVRVSQEIAETPKEKMTKDTLISEKNVDIRREIVKKIGIEKSVEILNAKVIDKKHGYELLSVDLGDGRIRPYLKMKNPSIDAHHIEGVSPGITTVEAALCYRNGLQKYAPPVQLT